jgi:hypothetical protein
MLDHLALKGEYQVECRNPDGSLVWTERIANGICTAGITDVLSSAFAQGTQRTWYIGMINNTSFDEVLAADTMASHAGWTELESYSGTRPTWNLTVSGGVAVSSSSTSFTLTSDSVIKGIFLTSNSTIGGSTGSLWSTALFTSARTLLAGQVLNVIYTLRGAGGSG